MIEERITKLVLPMLSKEILDSKGHTYTRINLISSIDVVDEANSTFMKLGKSLCVDYRIIYRSSKTYKPNHRALGFSLLVSPSFRNDAFLNKDKASSFSTDLLNLIQESLEEIRSRTYIEVYTYFPIPYTELIKML